MGVFEATGFGVSSCDFLADVFKHFIALAFADNVSATALAALAFLFVLEMFMELRNYIWDIARGQSKNCHARSFSAWVDVKRLIYLMVSIGFDTVWPKKRSWASSGFQVWPKKSSWAGSGFQVFGFLGFDPFPKYPKVQFT